MKPQEILKKENLCLEDHAPPCQAACPLHIDMRQIIFCIKEGKVKEAWETFAKGAILPHILASACNGPCIPACWRGKIDDALLIDGLEKSLLSQYIEENGLQTLLIEPYVSINSNLAIIGGGAAGLAAAAFLYQKGFKITLFEKNSLLLGNRQIDQRFLEADLADLSQKIDLKFNVEVGKDISYQEILANFPGIIISGRENLQTLDLAWDEEDNPSYDKLTYQIENSQIFWAGRNREECRGEDRGISLAERFSRGKIAAISLDRYLKKVSLTASRAKESSYQSDLYVDL
ncbi:MAG: NAD(P)-binding protein, partial [Clostridiales bacterium]